MPKDTTDRTGIAGSPVDFKGNPTVDPTENVKALVAAEKERSDDLREWEIKFFDYALGAVKELATVQTAAARDIAQLRAEHAKELRTNDIAIQANIRQVDIINANAAARQVETAIQTLAKTAAEQASALAKQLSETNSRYDERLRLLESGASKGEGKGSGLQAGWGFLIGGVGLLLTIIMIAGAIMKLT